MDKIKVSVIVPVYNVEQYLSKCLDSLVNQTLPEIEILVVNDGSPDNSQAIIDDYAARYPDKIRAFIKENGGLSDARNFGVGYATGEYIGFIDSDDYVDADMFEQLYNRAINTDADVVCCPLTHEYIERAVKTFYNESVFGFSVKQSPKILVYANSFAHNKIYRRSFWQKHEFLFPMRQWFEDSYLIYNVMLTANKVECVNIPFVHYVRSREESITNQFDMRLFDIFKSVQSIVGYFKENGVFESIEEDLEYVCLRHLTARLTHMRKCPDHKESRRFVREMVAFLDAEFPNWRKNSFLVARKKASLHDKVFKRILRSKAGMLLYVSIPRKLVSPLYRIAKRIIKLRLLNRIQQKKRTEEANENKRFYIQKNGMAVLYKVQKTLGEIGITSFADFGTCLGLVREGHLLAHDLDMDIGVIADPKDREKIRITLERNGFRLWRQYLYNDNPVEESYHYSNIKVDLNFYELTDEYARTWLFYTKPGHKYADARTRHVVEMTYSPIRGIKYQEFNGYPIALPDDPELLMTEKYGPTWRTPDKGWIYWESPAAQKLEETGCFKVFRYKGSGYVDQEDAYAKKHHERLAIIRQLQERELAILDELNRVCQERQIPYYLGGGTLLGAIRNGGYIPWCSKTTVWMDRDAYERFAAEAPAVLKDSIVLHHHTVTEKHFVPHIQLRSVSDTMFVDKHVAKRTKQSGPHINVMPLDSFPYKKSSKKLRKRYKFYQLALQFKHGRRSANTLRKKLIRLTSRFLSTSHLQKQRYKLVAKYRSPDNAYYICLPKGRVLKKEWFDGVRYISFEGREFPVPQQAEAVLLKIYGNYRRPLPIPSRDLTCLYVYKQDGVKIDLRTIEDDSTVLI